MTKTHKLRASGMLDGKGHGRGRGRGRGGHDQVGDGQPQALWLCYNIIIYIFTFAKCGHLN